MGREYIVDKDFKLKKERPSVWAIIRKILMFFVVTASLAVVYYILFALIFSTEEERRLRFENKLYEKEYPQLAEKEALLADVVEGLKIKDDNIYEEIFHTSAPDVQPLASIDLLSGYDSIPGEDIVLYSAKKLDLMEKSARKVEDNFRRISEIISENGNVLPPMTNPLGDYSFAQTGASVGSKINPFYKVSMRHDGLDMIAPSGDPVYAAADGTVSEVIRSRKGLGNVVVIDHGNGYFTRYAHLADMEAVKGRKVRRGTRLGYVGVSGNSFAPHLHYEVLRDSVVLDPVNHLFASVTPEEYVSMLVMSVSTKQSLD